MVRKRNYKAIIAFHALCLRDTLFYVLVSVFPITLFLFKEQYVTWYVISGYLYGLVAPSIVDLIQHPHRDSFVGVSLKMIRIILVLSSFVMILLNKSTYRVKFDLISVSFFTVLFVCVYHEVYHNKRKRV
jgi:hypothetical protein